MAEIHVLPLQACKNVVRQAPSLPQIKAATLLPYHLDLYGKISGMLALRRRRRRLRRRLRRRRRCCWPPPLYVGFECGKVSSSLAQCLDRDGQFGDTASCNKEMFVRNFSTIFQGVYEILCTHLRTNRRSWVTASALRPIKAQL